MNFTFALLLATLPLAPSAGNPRSIPNLDFQNRLNHWEGNGFSLVSANRTRKGSISGVWSRDPEGEGRKALLHRTIVVPTGARFLRCTAGVVRTGDRVAGKALEVLIEAAGRKFLPRQARTAKGWRAAEVLYPLQGERGFEYRWDVSAYAGKHLRIILVDNDDRRNCYVVASGFQLDVERATAPIRARATHREAARTNPEKEFLQTMQELVRKHRFPRLTVHKSQHFLALSTADGEYARSQLLRCETCYAVFFEHFQSRGFTVHRPTGKLMVAMFDKQKGLEAYLGKRMPYAVTGVYHRRSNRLVVYDYAGNRAFMAGKKRAEESARKGRTLLESRMASAAVSQQAWDIRTNTNTSTMMHEVSHQLSFNCGLLNRRGDTPCWLVEGLACYCEATADGGWQGIGQPNPSRTRRLARTLATGKPFIPLRSLVSSDDWLTQAKRGEQVLVGYAQSWALFRMLMRQSPRQMRAYLKRLSTRQTRFYRTRDFTDAFGKLSDLERRHRAYVRWVVQNEGPQK